MADKKTYLDQYDNGNPDKGIHDEHALSEEQILELESLVGRVLLNFNSLETQLDWIIAEAISDRSTQPGYTVTAEFNAVFTKKVLVFKSLYGPLVLLLENEELSVAFENLCSSLFKLKDIRNEIAHADWLEATNKYEVRLKIAADEGGSYALTRIMTPSYLQNKADELSDCIQKIEDFSELKDNGITSH